MSAMMKFDFDAIRRGFIILTDIVSDSIISEVFWLLFNSAVTDLRYQR